MIADVNALQARFSTTGNACALKGDAHARPGRYSKKANADAHPARSLTARLALMSLDFPRIVHLAHTLISKLANVGRVSEANTSMTGALESDA